MKDYDFEQRTYESTFIKDTGEPYLPGDKGLSA